MCVLVIKELNTERAVYLNWNLTLLGPDNRRTRIVNNNSQATRSVIYLGPFAHFFLHPFDIPASRQLPQPTDRLDKIKW